MPRPLAVTTRSRAHQTTAAVYPVCNTWLAVTQRCPKGKEPIQAARKRVSGGFYDGWMEEGVVD